MGTRTISKKVFIVEDSAPVRARLIELLDGIEGIGIVGEAGTPTEAVTGILRTRPDYVVLDFQLNGGTGADVLRAVRPHAPEIVFIVLTNHPQLRFRRLCMEAGAHAFFDKTTEFSNVREVIAGRRPDLLEHH